MENLLHEKQTRIWYNPKQKGVINIMTGTIKKKTDRGFGFISVEGQAKDLFFHSNDLSGVTFDQLQEGESVTFDVVEGAKGPSAKNVKRV